VRLFLERKIGFDVIPRIVEDALTNCDYNSLHNVDELLQHDKQTRQYVRNMYVNNSNF